MIFFSDLASCHSYGDIRISYLKLKIVIRTEILTAQSFMINHFLYTFRRTVIDFSFLNSVAAIVWDIGI